MIDYLGKFASEADAIADPVFGAFHSVDGGWRGDCVIPGVTVTRIADGVVLPFWYVTVSEQADRDELRTHPACVFAVDWSVPRVLMIEAGMVMTDYAVSPIYAGRDPASLPQ